MHERKMHMASEPDLASSSEMCVRAVFHFYFWENTLQFLLTEKGEFFSFLDTVERPPPLPFKNTTSSNSENN